MALQKILFILMFLIALPLWAQTADYGDISDEEIGMVDIWEDPEADAVVLFRVGVIKITPDFDMEMEVHTRIKVLTELGKESANVEIPYYYKDKIYGLEARSVNINGDEFELDDDNIFEERDRYYKKKVFAIPGVEIGSVFEVKYSLHSDYISRFEPWYFQGGAFTKLSIIKVYLPSGFSYTAMTNNTDQYDIQSTSEQAFNPYNMRKKLKVYTWTGRNIPGIKKEPYMSVFRDYYAQILFQLVAYKDKYTNAKIAKDWNNIAEMVWKQYEELIERDKGMEAVAKKLVADITEPRARVDALYNHICSEIRTAGSHGLWGDDFIRPEEVYRKREGSANEKNILLLNLLHHIGIDAKPVLISRRDNGRLMTNWVTLQQFNRVIVQVKIKGKTLYLNTSPKYCPPGYLTPQYNVAEGLLVNGKKGSIVRLKPLKPKSKVSIKTTASLDEEGGISAESKFTYTGMNAAMERERLEEKDLHEYLENKLKEISAEAVLDTFEYTDREVAENPLKLSVTWHAPEYCEQAGEISYFSPPLITKITENPFKRAKRNFPIEYDYPYGYSESIKIKLPEGMQISEKPKNTRASITKMLFNKTYFTGTDYIECRRSFSMRRDIFSPREYEKLKDLYDQAVLSDQDQVVLIKAQGADK